MTRVKICGITSLDDALAACDAGADAVGFVFAEEAKKRNRYIDPEAAQRIVEALPPWVTTVAVVVGGPEARLREYLSFLDRVQVHGADAARMAAALGCRAIPAFRVKPGFSIMDLQAQPFRTVLLDAYVPGQEGGTGQTFDWDVARDAEAAGIQVILAGGLTPENVGEAVRRVHPHGVDTSGGVEAAPGKKDHERIRAFINNAKLSLS